MVRRLILFTLAILCLSLVAACSDSAAQGDGVALPSLQGRYRVIASFTDSAERAGSLVNAFRSAPGLDDRDVAWFVVGPETIVSNLNKTAVPSRAQFARLHTVDGFQTVLVGKDGTLKASQLGGLDIQGLLDAIDQMPMRQQEMQQ